MLPSVAPSNRIGSCPGPAQYPKVQRAVASVVENPLSMLLSPGDMGVSECQDREWGGGQRGGGGKGSFGPSRDVHGERPDVRASSVYDTG